MSKRNRVVVNATPIYDYLQKKTDIAYYDTPNNDDNANNLIKAIQELNTEDLYHEIEENKEKNKEEFKQLF